VAQSGFEWVEGGSCLCGVARHECIGQGMGFVPTQGIARECGRFVKDEQGFVFKEDVKGEGGVGDELCLGQC